MFSDFLQFVLDGKRPSLTEGALPTGTRWTWIADGVVRFDPPDPVSSVVVSAGIHGDETAPIEMLSALIADIATGRAALRSRLLVIFGNIDAMRTACRYRDDDLNRLFNGHHASLPESREAPRASALETAVREFFGGIDHAKWHIDMHTAIRPSIYEQFALLPHTDGAVHAAMVDWLRDAGLSAVLLHREQSNTFTSFSAAACGALAATLELGKVRPFGHNDLTRFAASDRALRRLIAGQAPITTQQELKILTVVGQITKQSDDFALHVSADVANFTPFPRGTLLAEDGDYRYIVEHDEERIVFPNSKVKPGLRAGLMVVDTTTETLASLV
jgi:succinylglutamate desuccinylase